MYICLALVAAWLASPAFASNPLLPRTDQSLIGPIFFPTGDSLAEDFIQARQQTKDAIDSMLQEGQSSFGAVDNQETSFSVSVFSTISNDTLFSYHFEAPKLNGSYTKGKLSDDTIYRVGSVGKVFTIYEFLAHIGDKVYLDPVTDYIPELAAAAQDQPKNPILYTNWEEVTIGSLAAQVSGIGRDYRAGDYAFGGIETPPQEFMVQSGYPPASTNDNCSYYDYDKPSCNRQQLIDGIINHPPAFPSYTKAAYSNLAYVLLSMVYANITGDSLEDGFQKLYRDELGMVSTFAHMNASLTDIDAVVPYNDTWAIFSYDLAIYWAPGNQYSTINDMSKLGRSILQSTKLPSMLTRRWMKPLSSTSQWVSDVGAPWEISRLPVVSDSKNNLTRIVDIYAKGGDVGKYSSVFELVPDHGLGITILTAGAVANGQAQTLKSLVTEAFVNAAEGAAKKQAKQAFTGTFVAKDLNSSIVLEVDSGPGINVKKWISNGTDFLNSPLITLGDVRIMPAQLTHEEDGTTYHAFRATFAAERDPDTAGDLWPEYLDQWNSVDTTRYDNIASDHFIVGMDAYGKVQSIEPRVLKVVLYREN